MYFSLAWRNIWRNKKRSFITIASVFCAVFFALFMRSLQVGVFKNTVENMTSFSCGYIQVHAEGYQKLMSINNTFANTQQVIEQVETLPYVTHAVPRLESAVIAASDDKSEVALIVGVDPERENRMNGLSGRVRSGNYFSPEKQGVLIGEGLAENLGIGIGDEVVLLGQGYHGVTAAGSYTIIGILKYPVPEMNNRAIAMTISDAQVLFDAPDRATSLSVMLTDDKYTDRGRSEIEVMLGDTFEVFTWRTTLKELAQMVTTKYVSSWIILMILYMVVGFGIFGTVLMMTLERLREYGILIAIGMKKRLLMIISVCESIFLSLSGVVLGIAVALPALAWLHVHPFRLSGELAAMYEDFGFEPIIPFDISPLLFLAHPMIVLGISLVVSIYPVIRLASFNPVDALRSH